VKVGYLTFGRDDLGYGLALCLDRAGAAGAEFLRVTPATAKLVDVLVFSVFWWEHVWALAEFLRRAGIRKADKQRPRIVVGGFNTFNPVPLAEYADVVVCGDGEGLLAAAILGEQDPAFFADVGPVQWRNEPTVAPFAHVTNGIARIELARGCKARCRFCQVAHLKPYREADPGEVTGLLQSVRRSGIRRVSLFAPEPTMHRADHELTDACKRLGLVRVDSDVRLDRLARRQDAVPRVGIEGLSARLRRSVGKPYSQARIVDAVRQAIVDGRKGLFMYIILDLPGEATEDWDEFRGLLKEIGRIPGADSFVIKPSPSVFMPGPHTPMAGQPIHWDRPYRAVWAEFFGRGAQRDWEAVMAERSRVFAPESRILSMIATRGGAEFYEVERLLAYNKAIRVGSDWRPHCISRQRLLACLERYGGPDRWCGPMDATSAPWSVVDTSAPA